MWGGGGAGSSALFSMKERPHKEFLGSDLNWGVWGVFLYVYVLFFGFE